MIIHYKLNILIEYLVFQSDTGVIVNWINIGINWYLSKQIDTFFFVVQLSQSVDFIVEMAVLQRFLWQFQSRIFRMLTKPFPYHSKHNKRCLPQKTQHLASMQKNFRQSRPKTLKRFLCPEFRSAAVLMQNARCACNWYRYGESEGAHFFAY